MTNSTATSRVHLRVTGRVQGVYYRASMLQQAQRLGLTGWVMNCPDWSVEAVAEGSKAKLEELIAWCHQGPEGARVSAVEANWQKPENNFIGFAIRRE
jgi:acylphosphatase